VQRKTCNLRDIVLEKMAVCVLGIGKRQNSRSRCAEDDFDFLNLREKLLCSSGQTRGSGALYTSTVGANRAECSLIGRRG
jgi:hypothetical protein